VVLTDKIPETAIEEHSAAWVLNIPNKGGITKDGMLCKSYAASKMQIQKTALCLGNNVIKLQLEQAKKELESLLSEKSGYEKDIQNRMQLITLIDNVEWKAESYNFNSSQELSEIDSSNYGVEFIPFYRDRYRDLANVKIEEAKYKVEKQSEKLRDVFLHDFVAELNEKIISAKEEIAAINSELKRIPFGRDIYQFKMEEKSDRQVFFTICQNLEMYSESPDLFTERTVSDEKLADDVQAFLNKILDTEEEEDYSDYRNYNSSLNLNQAKHTREKIL